MAAGDSDPQLLRETVAEIFREAVVKFARSAEGSVFDDEWRRGGNGDDEPDQGGEGEATEGAELKIESMWRAEVMNDGEGEDEDDGRDRGYGNQRDIDGAMKLLPRTAVRTGGEMRFIVSTHLGSDAGYVVAPAAEDLAYEWIDALTHINL